MTSSLDNGFLATLSILASGYIIYTAPIIRLWWPKLSGYTLYFFTIAMGLGLFYFSYTLIFISNKLHIIPLNLMPEHAAFLAFPMALVLWVLAKTWVQFRCCINSDWEYNLNLKSLNEKGLDQIIYKNTQEEKMTMVTLENNKVYTGWPISSSEDNKWLRLVPQWSGYRDEKFRVYIETDYSKVYKSSSPEQGHMLILVDRIVTVQPFDLKVFENFNSKN